MKDCIEFYDPVADTFVGYIDSNMVPVIGSMISIRQETYEVVNITYAFDYFSEPHARMRANVTVMKAER